MKDTIVEEQSFANTDEMMITVTYFSGGIRNYSHSFDLNVEVRGGRILSGVEEMFFEDVVRGKLAKVWLISDLLLF